MSVENFRKSYGGFVAVEGLSFSVEQGEIFGLLGPNGAGKTTTLECLEGLRRPDSGRLRILGYDPITDAPKLRNQVGVQLQMSGLPGAITVEEAMGFFGAYHGIAPRLDLLTRLGLDDKRRKQYHELSVGLQRRLALALAVAHNPRVVILDEPTAGLDVNSRTELHSLMLDMKRSGTTIILATHDMAEAEKMADRVAILLSGKIAATGTPRELTATGAGFTKISCSTEQSTLLHERPQFPSVDRRTEKDEYVIFFSTDPGPTVSAILEFIASRGDKLIDLRVERPSLEERFLEITGKGGVGQ